MSEKFVVAWNPIQQVFSVETLEKHLEINRNAFRENTPATFIILELFNSHHEASEFCLRLQAIRNKRLETGVKNYFPVRNQELEDIWEEAFNS